MEDARPGTPPERQPSSPHGLSAEVRSLREELAHLRAQLGQEVRTRRIVVVEDDGFERLVATGSGHFGHLTLRGRTPEGRSTAVELFANDPTDGDGANVGLSISDDGDVVASLDVTQGQAVTLWVAPGDEPTT